MRRARDRGAPHGGEPAALTGGTDAGCRADDQTKLDAAGEYAYVLGTEAQRATIASVPGATFLPFSAAQPGATHILTFREILAGSSFAYSPQQVTQINDPAATEAAMGHDYPRASICALSSLTAGGVTGCTPWPPSLLPLKPQDVIRRTT